MDVSQAVFHEVTSVQQFSKDTDKLMCYNLSEGIFSSAEALINGCAAVSLCLGHFSSTQTLIN